MKYDPFSYEVQVDPYPVYHWMREHAPVYHNPERNFYALSRYSDVVSALRDPARFTNKNGISLEPELWGPQAYKSVFFLALDPPDHGALRGLISKDFTPRHVGIKEPRIRELTRKRLEPLLERDSFDFAADYAAAVPNDVVCEMLGIPASDWDMIRADTDLLTKREDESDGRSSQTLAAAFRLATYYVQLVADLRRHPGDDLTSILTQADANGKITDSEIVAFLFLIVSGGNESTGKLIGNAWYHGWRQPDVQRAGLHEGRYEDWAAETLRYDSSSQMTSRTLTQDTVIHGTRIQAGERIVLLHASGNRDHRVFDEPDRFDIDRDTRKMISFGAGPHHCLGGALAKLEIQIILEEIGAIASEYEIDMSRAERVHSAHQRGFSSLPCTIVRRK